MKLLRCTDIEKSLVKRQRFDVVGIVR